MDNQTLIPIQASMLQQQYWLNQNLFPDTAVYNIPSVFKVKGKINTQAFRKSIEKITQRHEIFRTVFSPSDEGFKQVISPSVQIDLKEINTSGDNCDEHIRQIISSYINTPFHLEKEPLLRTCLIRINEEDSYLIILMHHIITDLHTRNIFSEELSTLYKALNKDQEIYLPEPLLQYRHYAEYHNEWMKTAEYDRILAAWKDTLSDVEDLTGFPTDKKRPRVHTLNGTSYHFELTPVLTAELKKLAYCANVNLFVLTLSAYALLLHRYSGQQRFAIGVPLSNRRKEEYYNVAGCFMNIVPIVVDFTKDLSLRELIVKIRRAMLSAHKMQEVPYENIVRTLGKLHDSSINPIFQAGFTFEPPMEIHLEGASCETYPVTSEGSRLDHFFILWESGGILKGNFEYSTDLFEKTTIERIVKNYKFILQQFSSSINIPASLVPIISPEEKEQILFDWNKSFYANPENICIHQLFELQEKRNPYHPALVYDQGEMTYQELNQKANQLAHYLLKKGISIEDNVGIFIERSPEMMIAIYAVLKSGAVYVPIETNYPPDRIRYMAEDAQLKCLITKSSVEDISLEVPLIRLEEEWEEISKESTKNPETGVTSKNLAYIIYTSGSTGKPKGVMIEHHSVVNFIYWRQRMYPLTTEDTILLKTPTIFDISVLELFWWAFFGAKLCILEPEGEKFPDRIIKAVDRFRIRFMQFVPSMFNAFLEYANDDTAARKLSSLYYISTIGEALSASTVNTFNEFLYKKNGTRLINTYGPTETTVEVSYFECTSSKKIETVPIGRPMDNIKLFVVDINMNPQPIGVKGELLIGGAGTGRGYYNRPELTQERFITLRYNGHEERVYRTGDLARYLPDGNIDFLGRMDFQVKIRGYRIELGEIESVIRQSNMVRDTVVMPNDKTEGEKQLIAYIIPDPAVENVREQLLDRMKKKLPDYMVPSIIVLLNEFPSLPNGKLDRKALPKPEGVIGATQGISLPQSVIEIRLAEIWKEVLKREEIGIDHNFFDVGGNSLLLIQTASRIREKLQKQVEVFKLFQYPTIRLFAGYLSDITEDSDLGAIGTRMQKKRATLVQRKNTFDMNKT